MVSSSEPAACEANHQLVAVPSADHYTRSGTPPGHSTPSLQAAQSHSHVSHCCCKVS